VTAHMVGVGRTQTQLTVSTGSPSTLDLVLFAATCDDLDDDHDLAGPPILKRTSENTLVFNHRDLRPEGNGLQVLAADDGGYFQILFKCTSPAYFTYSITGDAAAQPESTAAQTQPESVTIDPSLLTTRGITMRHDARFLRYHVTARLREGIRPTAGATSGGTGSTRTSDFTFKVGNVASSSGALLYSMAFDVWVNTKPDWKLGIIGGVAVSKLVDKRYAVIPDEKNAPVFLEDGSQSRWHSDVMALANVYYSKLYLRSLNLGFAFGIGSSGSTPRFFAGPSVVFGRYFVLTGGVAFGWVSAPPLGQRLGQPPVNGDNTLNSASSRFTSAAYFGIGFTWIERRDQFAASLTAASVSNSVGSCVSSVSTDHLALGMTAKEEEVKVQAGDDCLWTALARDGQFKLKNGSGKGNGSFTVVGDAPGGAARKDVVLVTGPQGSTPKTVALSQGAKPTSCVTVLGSGDSVSFDHADTQEIRVEAEDGCEWTATIDPDDSGFSISATTKKVGGGGSVTVARPKAAATATLKVAGPVGADPLTVKLARTK